MSGNNNISFILLPIKTTLFFPQEKQKIILSEIKYKIAILSTEYIIDLFSLNELIKIISSKKCFANEILNFNNSKF